LLTRPFFLKNVPVWERVLRVIAALGATSFAFAMLHAPWSWLIAGSGIALAVTGLVGFCPMCAMVGRRLTAKAPLS
jgi:hypothetical protein